MGARKGKMELTAGARKGKGILSVRTMQRVAVRLTLQDYPRASTLVISAASALIVEALLALLWRHGERPRDRQYAAARVGTGAGA